mmetsp:Transcript_27586/g.60068  ORF Transcript_27586/g.60068 Transcript_27586/m.60068 type:complete len:234 (-) Transcript_27586:185-886(-)
MHVTAVAPRCTVGGELAEAADGHPRCRQRRQGQCRGDCTTHGRCAQAHGAGSGARCHVSFGRAERGGGHVQPERDQQDCGRAGVALPVVAVVFLRPRVAAQCAQAVELRPRARQRCTGAAVGGRGRKLGRGKRRVRGAAPRRGGQLAARGLPRMARMTAPSGCTYISEPSQHTCGTLLPVCWSDSRVCMTHRPNRPHHVCASYHRHRSSCRCPRVARIGSHNHPPCQHFPLVA